MANEKAVVSLDALNGALAYLGKCPWESVEQIIHDLRNSVEMVREEAEPLAAVPDVMD